MDISAEIAAIQAASQGSELRQPLVGALNKLNSGALPAVTASDVGKILKVGANGWEVGEKPGYMPVPTATKQITENGTYDVTNYASAVVNIETQTQINIEPIDLVSCTLLTNTATFWVNKNNNNQLTITIPNGNFIFKVSGTFSNSSSVMLDMTISKSIAETFVGKYLNFKQKGTIDSNINVRGFVEADTSPWDKQAIVSRLEPKMIISNMPSGNYSNVAVYVRLIGQQGSAIDAYFGLTITDD